MMTFMPKNPTGGGSRKQRAAALKAEMEAKQAKGTAGAEETAQPQPGQQYTLKDGDTLEGIARQVDQEPEAIWKDAKNKEIRESRGSSEELRAGDTLYIPGEEKGTGPVGQGDYIVKEGDCISSIAKDTGHFWEKVWNDPGNSELREVRQDPNILLPRDRVTVPPLRPNQEPGETEMRHRFVRRGEPEIFRLRVLHEDVPRGNLPYTLEIDGEVHTGTTDPNGRLECPIPGNARRGKLTLGEGEEQEEYELTLGDVDPISSISGVQRRLKNLGFDCGAVDDKLGAQTREALEEFQSTHELQVTGRPDETTRERLRTEHGS